MKRIFAKSHSICGLPGQQDIQYEILGRWPLVAFIEVVEFQTELLSETFRVIVSIITW